MCLPKKTSTMLCSLKVTGRAFPVTADGSAIRIHRLLFQSGTLARSLLMQFIRVELAILFVVQHQVSVKSTCVEIRELGEI